MGLALVPDVVVPEAEQGCAGSRTRFKFLPGFEPWTLESDGRERHPLIYRYRTAQLSTGMRLSGSTGVRRLDDGDSSMAYYIQCSMAYYIQCFAITYINYI